MVSKALFDKQNEDPKEAVKAATTETQSETKPNETQNPEPDTEQLLNRRAGTAQREEKSEPAPEGETNIVRADQPITSPVLIRADAEAKAEDSDDYLWMRAWGSATGLTSRAIEDMVQRAKDTGAPQNAIYELPPEPGSDEATWRVFDDIAVPDIREQLRKIVSRDNAEA